MKEITAHDDTVPPRARRQDVTLGVILVAAGIAFGVLGFLDWTDRLPYGLSDLVFGLPVLALTALVAGVAKLWPGKAGQ